VTVATRAFLLFAGLHGAVAVALGAYAAHGMSGRFSDRAVDLVETGSGYGLAHATALVAVAAARGRVAGPAGAALAVAGWGFALGALLFAGALHAMALTGIAGFGAVAPFGGAGLIAGWIAVLAAAGLPGGVPTAGRR
jgi:uncharacterized membrane protein YgdD (TMEM256/DUF423 family)